MICDKPATSAPVDLRSEEALYLYCLARSDLVREFVSTGDDTHGPVSVWTFSDLAAVASAVPIEQFSGPPAEALMNDLEWIGKRAVHHEVVVERVMRYSPVFPAGFGTLFSSFASLEKFLVKHHDTILRFLQSVADSEEWAVKVSLDKGAAQREMVATRLANHSEQLTVVPAGLRYLRERQISAEAERQVGEWVKETCERVVTNLYRHASRFCERPLISSCKPDAGPEIICNWAFLVERLELARFDGWVAIANTDFERLGLSFQVTGPWPPYSFCPSLLME